MHRTHFTLVHTRRLCEFMREKMFRFCSVFLVSAMSLLIKAFEGFVSRYVYRSKACAGEGNGSNFSANHSQEEDHLVSKKSTIFLSGGLAGNESLKLEKRETDTKEDAAAETEGSSDCLRCGLIVNSSKYEFVSGKDVCGYFEEPRMDNFVVQEMFVGSSEVLESHDQSLGSEILRKEVSVEETSLQEFDQESDSFSFCFKLFDPSFASNDGLQGCVSKLEGVDQETADNAFKICSSDEKINSADSENFGDGGKDLMEDDILEDTYVVELLPATQFRSPESNGESDAAGDDISISNVDQNVESTEKTFHEGYDSRNWMSSFLEESDQIPKLENLDFELNFDHTERTEELDDEYIELEPQTFFVKQVGERISCGDADEGEQSHKQDVMPTKEAMSMSSSQEQKICWDSDTDDDDEDEDEMDALLEHQILVQQMKMELKNCSRIRSLPTISEEECQTPELVEDLKPLEIDLKIEYKDVVQEIQKFYKSYIERMRKLDILNYQTLQAISFLQLKVSEVVSAGMKRADSVSRIRPYKGQRVYADPMHKSIVEMHRDLELVYVGHLCLSWEMLCWLYTKAQELLGYDSQGNHSYNRSAEEFQQFQVLVQRFIEDEPFQGQRIQNYVKNRCTIKCLLQVPTIKDYCLETKKERREDTDAVSLEMLIQTIRESMLIFREFLFADKRSTNVTTPKGIQETRPHLQNPLDLKLLTDTISGLHKKERKMKEHKRSQNCIVKKLKKHQEGRVDDGVMTSQVELRLVARVLRLSRLSTDQLVWCQNKVKNISFVGRKVHVEPSFLLFPC